MSKRTNYTPKTPFKFSLHVTDHLADTLHLSAEEHGCYVRLMFSYWRSGPPRDDDNVLARIVGMTPQEWCEVRPMVEPFFDVVNGQWLHWRLDEELEAAYDAINKASKAGRTGANARWGKDKPAARRNDKCEGDATALRSHCESEYQQKDKSNPTRARACKSVPPGDFEADVRIAECDLGIGEAA